MTITGGYDRVTVRRGGMGVVKVVVIAADDLSQVLVVHQSLGLHFFEHLAPSLMAALERRNLVEVERLRTIGRRVLRVEQRARNVLVARRQVAEAARPARFRLGERRACHQHEPGSQGQTFFKVHHVCFLLRLGSFFAASRSSCSVSAVFLMISVAVDASLKKICPSLATTRMRVVLSVSCCSSMSIVRSIAVAESFQPPSLFSSAVTGMPR